MHDAKAMLNELKAGNERYVANLSSTEKIPIPPPTLVKEQKPNAIILGCSDARVPVELAKSTEFLSIIDSYELGQNVVDLASSQPRRVRLQATRTEIPVRAATKADEELARASQERAVQTQISEQVQPVAPAETAPADHPRQPAQL